MSTERTKITYMGQPISHDELPAAPATRAEDWFAPVTLSARAIDRTSQLVPIDVWQPLGLHTWLSKAANQAFQKMPISHSDIRLGRLKYVFEYDASGPVLKTVILV